MSVRVTVQDLPCCECHEETVYEDKHGHQWCASCEAYNGLSMVETLTQASMFEPRWPGDWYGRYES